MKLNRCLLGLTLVVVLAAGSIGSASAGAWIQWLGGPQIELTKVEIPVWAREHPLEQYVWQVGSDWYSGYEFALNCAYPGTIPAVGGGDSFVDDAGQPIYIRIAQAVTNTGNEAWTDFHIRTIEGCQPYKIFGGWWPSDWNITGVADGWDFMRDPGGNTVVMPGQTLYNEVWIRVDPGANGFAVEVWPTVPEPGSLLALASGCGALLAGVRLRKPRK